MLNDTGKSQSPKLIPIKVVACYTVVSALWIYFSDILMGMVVHDPQLLTRIAMAKGFLFIAVTATLLYLHIRHHTSLLSASENRYRLLFEASPDLIVLTSLADKRYVACNGAFVEATGFSRAELQGKTSEDLEMWVELHRRREFYERLARDGHVRNFEGQLRMKSGEIGTFLLSAEMIELDGAPAVLSILRDISEIKLAKEEVLRLNAGLEQRVAARTAELAQAVEQLQEEIRQRTRAQEEIDCLNQHLLQQRSALEEANRELEAFSYSVSHDLRAPVRHIHSFLRIIREEHLSQLDETGAGYFTRVERACVRIEALIESLLSLSRLTLQPLLTGQVNLAMLVREAIAELQLAEPGRRVTVNIQPDLTVLGDGTLLRIAISNLVCNAWKFTGKTPEATIDFGLTEENGQTAYFIRDNGAGFDMAYADRLFGVFQRLHREEEFEGTGVGLATVQRIIQRHGGRIWALSEPNHGATFYFTLWTAPGEVHDHQHAPGSAEQQRR